MKWFRDMKISAKLVLVAILVSLIAGGVGAVGIFNVKTIAQTGTDMYEHQVEPINTALKLGQAFDRADVIMRDAILAKTPEERAKYLDNITQKSASITQYANEFEKSIQSQNVRDAYNAFLDKRKYFTEYLVKAVTFLKENKPEEALAVVRSNEFLKGQIEEQATIAKLVELKLADAKSKSEGSEKQANASTAMMLIIIVVGMALSIIFGLYLSRVISKPVKKLVKVAGRIADGDLNVFIETGDNDELGDLATAFRKMKDNLNAVLLDISAVAGQVATGSRQVSDSSIALSQGATEQAGSIEELTASIEQISSQTKCNAENANQANELSETAKINATQGKDQMTAMVKAMEEINEASSNISRIIKVIDDIAFQTNILALNAAVEAARAGQYGRGFAVVAEEVRNLAARSAGAAKETTDMIEGSINKVKAGTKIASETALALNKIVVDVEKVANIVKDIATASNEQTIGIGQVNQGIMQVSQVVQTNSATSEESAAASEELSSQAEVLKNSVSTFKLHKADTDAASAHGFMEKEKEMKIDKTESHSKPQPEKASKKKIILTEAEFGKY
jgi:methyl-accepting chemotaxis protein